MQPEIKIPTLLRELNNWNRWRLAQNKQGKWTKVPDESTRNRGRSFDATAGPSTANEGRGFVFTGGIDVPAGRVMAIDLDACRDPVAGTIEPWATHLLNVFGRSYTEVTPSGCGLRVWFICENPPSAREFARVKVKVAKDRAPNVPEGKSVEWQLFGYGVPQFVTVTGKHLLSTSPELRSVRDLDALDREWQILRRGPTRVDANALPAGEGPMPSLDAVEHRIEALAEPMRSAVLDANWRPLLGDDERDVSASAAFYRVVQNVLRAAHGHGAGALAFLLSRTAWGRGEVEESADPSRYARETWVAAELARIGAKTATPTGALFDDGFKAEDWAPPAPEMSPIALAAKTAVDWFGKTPAPRRYLLNHPNADGLLPMGKAATLTAAGGVGKTTVVVQLAVSIATGRDWLGHFKVDPGASRRVLLLLGEEDAEEVHRKIHAAGTSLELTEAEKADVVANITALALAGKVVPLLRAADGDATETKHFDAVLELLNARGPWGLVVIDPQSRFAGCDVEVDNSLATRFVQVCEKLTEVPGEPVVLDLAHSSKVARRMGGADSRGVTGLTDGFRWHATLRAAKANEAGHVILEVPKNNLGRPSAPLTLLRGHGGLLFAESVDDRRARAKDEEAAQQATEAAAGAVLDERIGKVLAAARGRPGLSKNELAALVGGNRPAAKEAIEAAFARGLLENRRQGQAHHYYAATPTAPVPAETRKPRTRR